MHKSAARDRLGLRQRRLGAAGSSARDERGIDPTGSDVGVHESKPGSDWVCVNGGWVRPIIRWPAVAAAEVSRRSVTR
jgi:hypothetical protein